MTAITNRIAYYVHDRSQLYSELDVLNEARRNPKYWNVFGAQGIAQIYKNVVDAINAAGADTRTYVNEYNVLQYSTDPDGGASDPYANWYRRNVEQLNSQGFGQVVTGIGVQYSIDARTTIGSNVHSGVPNGASTAESFRNGIADHADRVLRPAKFGRDDHRSARRPSSIANRCGCSTALRKRLRF